MKFFLDMPFPLAMLLIILFSLGIALLGLKLVRTKFSTEFLKANHEVGSYIFNAFGLIYAVLVGFVVFATWTEYNNAQDNIEKEANILSDLFLDAGGFPDSMKHEIQNKIIDYINAVINEEWDKMKYGEYSLNAREKFEKLWFAYTKADINQINNIPVYHESVSRFNTLSEYRRIRIMDAKDNIPAVIWFVIITGFIISLCYTYFFGSESFLAQSIMIASLTITNVLILFMIYILDHPFVGNNSLTPEAFQNALDFMDHVLNQYK
jgi:hypothetical protein